MLKFAGKFVCNLIFQITQILEDEKKFNVSFFGTGETAELRAGQLTQYNEISKSKNNKKMNQKYLEAVEAIEEAIQETGIPISVVNERLPAVKTKKSRKKKGQPYGNIKFEATPTAAIQVTSLGESSRNVYPVKKEVEKKRVIVRVQAGKSETVPSPAVQATSLGESSRNMYAVKKEVEKKGVIDKARAKLPIKSENESQSVDRVVTSASNANPSQAYVSKMWNLEPAKRTAMIMQRKMIRMTEETVRCLPLKSPDTTNAVRILREWKSDVLQHVTQLMLLKYPFVVEKFMSLRVYFGDVGGWKLNPRQTKKFEMQSLEIRTISHEIFSHFQVNFIFHFHSF